MEEQLLRFCSGIRPQQTERTLSTISADLITLCTAFLSMVLQLVALAWISMISTEQGEDPMGKEARLSFLRKCILCWVFFDQKRWRKTCTPRNLMFDALRCMMVDVGGWCAPGCLCASSQTDWPPPCSCFHHSFLWTRRRCAHWDGVWNIFPNVDWLWPQCQEVYYPVTDGGV